MTLETSRLLQAAERNLTAEALVQLERGADTLARDEFGFSPLFWAAKHGNGVLLEALLQHPADLELTDKKGLTSLLWAAKNGSLPCVTALLKAGANAFHEDQLGRTALHYAASIGCQPVVEVLLLAGVSPDMQDKNGDTALTLAFAGAYYDLGFYLAEFGCSIHHAGSLGRTPLIMVAMNPRSSARLKTVRMLLKRGAQPNAADAAGNTPLLLAARSGDNALIRLLLANGALLEVEDAQGQTATHWACRGGHGSTLKLLISSGADVDKTDHWGGTPLHHTVRSPKSTVLKILLEAGADPNIRDSKGLSPLQNAVQRSDLECVDQLLRYGADINLTSARGDTPLDYCLGCRMHTMAYELLKRGAMGSVSVADSMGVDVEKLNTPDESGILPIQKALVHGQISEIHLLVHLGSNVDLADRYGTTPLMHAAQSYRDGFLEALLQYHPALELRDDNGSTALAHAVKGQRIERVRALLEAGAYPWTFDREGLRPSAYAKAAALTSMERLLKKYEKQHGPPPTDDRLETLNPSGANDRFDAALRGDIAGTVRDGHRIEERNMNGATCLIFAAAAGHVQLVEALLRAGASPLTQDWFGKTALDWACTHRCSEVIDLLRGVMNIAPPEERIYLGDIWPPEYR